MTTKKTKAAVGLQIRQGDVLIEYVAALPDDDVYEPVTGPIVLAHGEATGHAHTVEGRGARLLQGRKLGRRFLVLPRGGRELHQEHDTNVLPATAPGVAAAEVGRQREYSPQAVRNVAD